MFELLYDPLKEIKKCKKQSYSRILMFLVAASLFETIGLLFLGWRYFNNLMTTSLVVNGVVFVLFALILLHLLVALFFSISMHILDGKGGYYEGLTTLVLAFIAPAVSIFFGGALTFIPFGVYPALLLIAYGYVVGFATLFRAAKELFELDYAGVFAGFLITAIPLSLVCFAFTLL